MPLTAFAKAFFFFSMKKLFIERRIQWMVAEITICCIFRESHWTIDMFPVCVYKTKSHDFCDTIDDLFYELLLLTRNDLLVSWLANSISYISFAISSDARHATKKWALFIQRISA